MQCSATNARIPDGPVVQTRNLEIRVLVLRTPGITKSVLFTALLPINRAKIASEVECRRTRKNGGVPVTPVRCLTFERRSFARADVWRRDRHSRGKQQPWDVTQVRAQDAGDRFSEYQRNRGILKRGDLGLAFGSSPFWSC